MLGLELTRCVSLVLVLTLGVGLLGKRVPDSEYVDVTRDRDDILDLSHIRTFRSLLAVV